MKMYDCDFKTTEHLKTTKPENKRMNESKMERDKWMYCHTCNDRLQAFSLLLENPQQRMQTAERAQYLWCKRQNEQ